MAFLWLIYVGVTNYLLMILKVIIAFNQGRVV